MKQTFTRITVFTVLHVCSLRMKLLIPSFNNRTLKLIKSACRNGDNRK